MNTLFVPLTIHVRPEVIRRLDRLAAVWSVPPSNESVRSIQAIANLMEGISLEELRRDLPPIDEVDEQTPPLAFAAGRVVCPRGHDVEASAGQDAYCPKCDAVKTVHWTGDVQPEGAA